MLTRAEAPRPRPVWASRSRRAASGWWRRRWQRWAASHVQRAAFKAQGNGFSQMRACRVRGHQSRAAGMWGCRWAQACRRRPAVSGGEALCEEHGAAGRRQAV